MKIQPLILLLWALSSCIDDEKEIYTSQIGIDELIDSLESEMNNQWFMPCYKGIEAPYPSFYPCLKINATSITDYKINEEKIESIPNSVFQFYMTNYVSNNKEKPNPNYFTLKRTKIDNEISEINNKIDKLDYKKYPEIHDYYNEIKTEWIEKLNALNILEKDEMRLPGTESGIYFYYLNEDDNKLVQQITDSVLFGFYKIRDFDAMLYFKEPYIDIFHKAVKKKNSVAIKQLDALKILHPVNIIDQTKCKFDEKVIVVEIPEK
jgi:hypothetical protein